MIKNFLEIPKIMPPYAQIPTSFLKKLRRAYENKQYDYGLELAVSLMELYSFGHFSSDDEHIADLLEIDESNAKAKVASYVDKVKETKGMEIYNSQLDVIADMTKEGKTQREIAQALRIAQSTVSKRLARIKKEFPELLKE